MFPRIKGVLPIHPVPPEDQALAGEETALHHHQWQIAVHICSEDLDHIGIGVDFRVVRSAVDEVLARLKSLADELEQQPGETDDEHERRVMDVIMREFRDR